MIMDEVLGGIDISISGMRAQSKKMSAIYANVANARTVDAGNGLPYRRVEVIMRKKVDDAISGVEVARVTEDNSPFPEQYDPGHPYANEQGYVKMPNINLPQEMINLTMATRAYQANAAILRRQQEIADRVMELLR